MASRHKVVNTAHFPIIEVLEDSTVQKAIQNKGVQLPVATEVLSLLAHNEPIQTLTTKTRVIVVEKKTGKMFVDVAAHDHLHTGGGRVKSVRLKASTHPLYDIYLQTVPNRKVRAPTKVIYEDRRVPLYVVPGAKPAPAKPAPKPVVRHYPTPTLATLSPQRLALICAFLDGADLARLATTNKFFAAFLGPTPDASDDDAMNALAKHVGSLQPSPSVESIDSLSPMTPRQVHANFWRAILQEHDAFALVLESMNPAASLQNDPRGVYVYMYGYQRKVLRVWERIERRLQHLRSLAEWGATDKSEEWVLPSGYTLDRFQRAFDEWHYEAVVNADIHLQELADEKAGHKGKRGSKMAAKTTPESAEEDEHVVPPEVNIALPAEVMFSIFHRAELDFEHICLALRMDKAKDRPLDRVCKFGPPQVFDYAKGLHTHTDRVEQEQTGKPDPNWHPDYVHCVRLASLIDCEFGQEGLFVNAALDHPNYGKIYLHVSPELGPDHIVANSYLEYLEEFEKRLAQAEDKVLPVISSN